MKVLLLTPPTTQLNTPYPATQYIKGFLRTQSIESFQADLSLEMVLEIFSQKVLTEIFEIVDNQDIEISENAFSILENKNEYIGLIDPIIKFLQGKNNAIAYSLVQEGFLPKASRFEQLIDLDEAFGYLGNTDKAKYLATLFLQDLADFIREAVDEHFGLSKYAERLGRSATHFDDLEHSLKSDYTFIDSLLEKRVKGLCQTHKPDLVLITIPFPGNLYSALRIGDIIKKNFSTVKISVGGGYPNTELRSLTDPRIFSYVDFITLDDGERPVLNLIEFLIGKRSIDQLKRTFLLKDSSVFYANGGKEPDFPFSKTGTPTYDDLNIDQYLSVLEIANPMHRLWSDGRWNKLTMAHGCYWKKCSFCDVSLDYISNYQPITANLICNRMEQQIQETGQTGFHFVDEAAPPALMRDVALEILNRNLKISWWANIRFEEAFSSDLCQLLSLSGCVAVSGGLEVASNRLLELMEKGVSVEQVARVCQNFTDSGILVHAYLMYGFPTQTVQETIDSLEYVRQMFQLGIIQSGFWHQFAMTYHSPVGKNPGKYRVKIVGPKEGGFAQNDLYHDDPLGADHELFGKGLSKSLFNYMQGIGLDFDLQEWFEFKVPKSKISSNYIENYLNETFEELNWKSKKIYFLGKNIEAIKVSLNQVQINYRFKSQTVEMMASKKDWENLFILLDSKGQNLGLMDKKIDGPWLDQFFVSSLFEYLRANGLFLV